MRSYIYKIISLNAQKCYERKLKAVTKYVYFRDIILTNYLIKLKVKFPLPVILPNSFNYIYNPSLTSTFKYNLHYISRIIYTCAILLPNNATQFTFTLGQYAGNIREWLNRTLSFGYYYIQGCMTILLIDACLVDDEPLWEPLEWSMVQTWILVIFIFG
jgi:hypothetical protein